MFFRYAVILLFAAPACAQDWNPQLVGRYLDSRQQEWFEWSTARTPDGPCISCHTGVTYLLARPMLRRTNKEASPTRYETGLLEAIRSRVRRKDAAELAKAPTQGIGIDAVLLALFLAREDSGKGQLS